jgi:hypothetical protein
MKWFGDDGITGHRVFEHDGYLNDPQGARYGYGCGSETESEDAHRLTQSTRRRDMNYLSLEPHQVPPQMGAGDYVAVDTTTIPVGELIGKLLQMYKAFPDAPYLATVFCFTTNKFRTRYIHRKVGSPCVYFVRDTDGGVWKTLGPRYRYGADPWHSALDPQQCGQTSTFLVEQATR